MSAKDDWRLSVAVESFNTTIDLLEEAGLPSLAGRLKPYLDIIRDVKELRRKS